MTLSAEQMAAWRRLLKAEHDYHVDLSDEEYDEIAHEASLNLGEHFMESCAVFFTGHKYGSEDFLAASNLSDEQLQELADTVADHQQ